MEDEAISTTEDQPTVGTCLRLGHGAHERERDHVVDALSRLDARLRSFEPDAVDMLLSVKERDTPSQRTTLEAWIAGFAQFVATSDEQHFDAALAEVRDDMVRQISDHKNRTEPRNNRHLRDSI